MNDVLSARGIAPKLVREIENIGEEVGDVPVRGPFAHDYASAVLPLRDRIVPVFHPSPLAEQQVGIVRNIAGSKYSGNAALQVFIYHHAVADLDSAAGKQFGGRLHADTRDHHLAGEYLSVSEDYRLYRSDTPQFPDCGRFDEANASRGVVVLKEARHRWCEELLPDAALAQGHRDGNALLRQHRGHFHADEAAADYDGLRGALRTLPDSFGVIQRAQISHVLQPGAGK